MYRILLKYTNSGECIKINNVDDKVKELNNNEEIKEVDIVYDAAFYHKEPFRSNYLKDLIKKKCKELLNKKQYVFNLSNGWRKDEEYKKWCEDIIAFCNSFEDLEIKEKIIKFPIDPWGVEEVLEL
jgi:hypothetical protein